MKTSIVILTFNQLHFTVNCLNSIRANTPEEYEIIIVDNGSTDGTVEYLKSQSDIRTIFNAENKGFAAGCNQGGHVSTGEYILFLNNDTIVTPGWLGNMLSVFSRHQNVGMVGPISNFVGNKDQLVPVAYRTINEIEPFSRVLIEQNKNIDKVVAKLIGFALLARKSVLEQVGWFDEQFKIGSVEDDDLCLRVVLAGYDLRVAYDSFVHHEGHGSQGSLPPSINPDQVYHDNLDWAYKKWGGNIHEILERTFLDRYK